MFDPLFLKFEVVLDKARWCYFASQVKGYEWVRTSSKGLQLSRPSVRLVQRDVLVHPTKRMWPYAARKTPQCGPNDRISMCARGLSGAFTHVCVGLSTCDRITRDARQCQVWTFGASLPSTCADTYTHTLKLNEVVCTQVFAAVKPHLTLTSLQLSKLVLTWVMLLFYIFTISSKGKYVVRCFCFKVSK